MTSDVTGKLFSSPDIMEELFEKLKVEIKNSERLDKIKEACKAADQYKEEFGTELFVYFGDENTLDVYTSKEDAEQEINCLYSEAEEDKVIGFIYGLIYARKNKLL